MKLPNWFKIIWWVILITVDIILLYNRFPAISEGTANSIDAFFFFILVILLLLPLFTEFDFFGIKLKSEISDLKNEINDKFINIKSEIQSIGIQTQVNPQFYFTPPADSQLPLMENKFREILSEEFRKHNIQSPIDIQTELSIPHKVNYLFIIRYTIERELRRIWKERFNDEIGGKPIPIHKILQYMRENELIDTEIFRISRDVYSICSPAIHAEDISEEKYRFVQDIAPRLITTLLKI